MTTHTFEFNKALVAKLSEHFAEFQRDQESAWKRIALELPTDGGGGGDLQRWQDLSSYFKRSLVYKLDKFSKDREFVDRMQYPCLRRVYSVVVELVDKAPPKFAVAGKDVEDNRLFLKSLIDDTYDAAVVAAYRRRSIKGTKIHVCINVGDPVYNLTESQRELLMKIEQNRTRKNRKKVAANRQLEPGTWHDAATGSPVILDGVPVAIGEVRSPAKNERSARRLLDEESLEINTQEYDQMIKDSLEPEMPPLPVKKRLLSIASTVDSDDDVLELSSSTDSSTVVVPGDSIPGANFIIINPDEILNESTTSHNNTTAQRVDPLQLSMQQPSPGPSTASQTAAPDTGEKDSTTSEPLFTPSSGESAKTTTSAAEQPEPSGIFRTEDLIARSKPPTLILEEDATEQLPAVKVQVERQVHPDVNSSAVQPAATSSTGVNGPVKITTSAAVQTDETANKSIDTEHLINRRSVATQTPTKTKVKPVGPNVVAVSEVSAAGSSLSVANSTVPLTAEGLVAPSFFWEDGDDEVDDDEEEEEEEDDEEEEEEDEQAANPIVDVQQSATVKEVSTTDDPPTEKEMEVRVEIPQEATLGVQPSEAEKEASPTVDPPREAENEGAVRVEAPEEPPCSAVQIDKPVAMIDDRSANKSNDTENPINHLTVTTQAAKKVEVEPAKAVLEVSVAGSLLPTGVPGSTVPLTADGLLPASFFWEEGDDEEEDDEEEDDVRPPVTEKKSPNEAEKEMVVTVTVPKEATLAVQSTATEKEASPTVDRPNEAENEVTVRVEVPEELPSAVQTDEPVAMIHNRNANKSNDTETPINHLTVTTQAAKKVEVEPAKAVLEVSVAGSSLPVANSTGSTVPLTAEGLVAAEFFWSDGDDDDDDDEDGPEDEPSNAGQVPDVAEQPSPTAEKVTGNPLQVVTEPVNLQPEVPEVITNPEAVVVDGNSAIAVPINRRTVASQVATKVKVESVEAVLEVSVAGNSPSGANNSTGSAVPLTEDGLVAASFFWEEGDDDDKEEEDEEDEVDEEDEEDEEEEEEEEEATDAQPPATEKEVSPMVHPPTEAENEIEVRVEVPKEATLGVVVDRMDAEMEKAVSESNDVEQISPTAAGNGDLISISQPNTINAKGPPAPPSSAHAVVTPPDLPIPIAPGNKASAKSNPPVSDSQKSAVELLRESRAYLLPASYFYDSDDEASNDDDANEGPTSGGQVPETVAVVAVDEPRPSINPEGKVTVPPEPLAVEAEPSSSTLPTPPPSSREASPPIVAVCRRWFGHHATLALIVHRHLKLYNDLRQRWRAQLFQPPTIDSSIFRDLNDLNNVITATLFPNLPNPSNPSQLIRQRSMVEALAIRIAYGATLEELQEKPTPSRPPPAAMVEDRQSWDIVITSSRSAVDEDDDAPPVSKRIRIESSSATNAESIVTIVLSDSEGSPSVVLPVRKKRCYRVRQTKAT